MATIHWGSASGHLSVGISVTQSPSTIDENTSSVTLTWKVYVRNDRYWSFDDQQTMTLSNAVSDSETYWLDVGDTPETVLIGTWTSTASPNYTSNKAVTLTASASGLYNGGTPSKTHTVYLDKRPPYKPDPPDSVTNTRVSDSRIDVDWVRPATADNNVYKWENVVIQRSKPWESSYYTVATISGSATSWSATDVEANSSYKYRVRGKNQTGSSAAIYPAAGYVDTTPAAPSNVAAAKNASGNIDLTWVGNSPATDTFEIQDGTTTLATVTGTSYTHVAPDPGATHQYRIRAVTDNPVLYSAWSGYSNTVQLQAPPDAPTDLSPNGSTVALSDPLTLQWTHNPVDTTEQTAFEVQHRPSGGAWTSTGQVASTTEAYTVPDGTYTAQQTIEWQVRTWGADPTASPWSAVATVDLTQRPTATISNPDGVSDVATPSVTIDWTYYHEGGHAQSAWQVEVYDAGSALIAEEAGTNETSWTTGDVLDDGASYTAKVRVRESSGLWSAWDEVTFSVVYDQPLPPVVTAEWRSDEGQVAVVLTAQSDGVAPETESISLERSLDGGLSWQLLEEGLGLNTEYADWETPADGEVQYRATAISALPSKASATTSLVIDGLADPVVWISGGPGFATVARLRYDPKVSGTTGRERVLNRYAGRSLPVESSGVGTPRSLTVKAFILPGGDSSTREELEAVVALPGPHLYRDPDGRRLYGSLSDVSWSRDLDGTTEVQLTITEADPGTAGQRTGIDGYAEVAAGIYSIQ